MTDHNKQITTIVQKIHVGERISREESLVLLETGDIFLLGELANTIRERKNGQYTSYNINVHLNPSNLCINGCSFCAFSRKEGEPGAFDLSLEEIIAQIKAKVTARTTELHVVGGVHPYKGLDFYTAVLAAIKKLYPTIYLKAFTATEVHHMAEISGVTVEKALTALKASGLDSMPGGGAEVFAPRVRKKVCPQKISGEVWLEVHRKAHSLGIKTNATMLYGHIETPQERVDHLFSLRNLQDETGGFQAFIPLPYHPYVVGRRRDQRFPRPYRACAEPDHLG